MRRFKFRLETVLHHRETVESLREQAFAEAQGVVMALETRIAEKREEFRRTLTERPGSRSGETLDPADILDRERYLVTLQAAIAQLERQLESARIVAEERRVALVAARQAREAVSRLREKDLAAYTAQGLKIEQDTLDELATLRHVRALRAQTQQSNDTKEKAANG